MRIAISIGLAALALPAAAGRAQPAGDAAANWEAIVQCARQTGAPARHACIDQVLRGSGLLDSEREMNEARQSFGQQRRSEAVPVPPPAAPAAPAMPAPAQRAEAAPAAPTPAPAPAAPPAPLRALQTEVASARLAADRKLVITTREGAVWRQTETIELRASPRAGDSFEIEEAALGGHRCKLGRSRIFRCERVN
ncbi:hypothetical protein SLG_31800 [Sphingobium sp. SYK-6]|uniref:hypothetical protein n=1 Tax=Sphingobium sp. (strain NBRC 103272 / SYK-6) TaxID=627192 RepID=UPI0002277637|nr:hypothetical protein [Sphingobium sp. SYK-6]BAK67855.1 hypothetical protein SLG_31800 [Sphingobium sp. SYK-6]